MAVEPLVSDPLIDASAPRRTNCEEMEGKDALAFEKTPKSIYCGKGRAEHVLSLRFLPLVFTPVSFYASGLFCSKLNGNKAQ